MWTYIYPSQLCHYGVKGMKWGVRRTPLQLGHITTKNYKREIYRNHKSTPKTYKPNTILDHYSDDGVMRVRTFYGKNGKKEMDIHRTSHGNPKHHNYGKHGEHALVYIWKETGELAMKMHRELTDRERKENSDIL